MEEMQSNFYLQKARQRKMPHFRKKVLTSQKKCGIMKIHCEVSRQAQLPSGKVNEKQNEKS
jgi:hypothetical protein